MIEMHVQPTLGIMSTRHNISGARLLTPIWMGTIVTMVTKVTVGTKWLDDLCNGGISVFVLL